MVCRNSLIQAVLLLLAGPVVGVKAQSQELDVVWLPYPQHGIELGQGYDLLNDRKTSGVCIDFFPVEDKGLESTYSIAQVKSFTETFARFGISASGQLSLAILSAKASLQFSNSARTLTDSERYAVTAQVRRGAWFVSPVPGSKPGGTLTTGPGAESETSSTPDNTSSRFQIAFKDTGITEQNFDTVCGTHYVAAILSGINVNASLVTNQSDSVETSSFSGQVEIDVPGLFSGGGALEGANEATRRAYGANVDAYLLGGEKYDMPTDVAGLTAFIKSSTNALVTEAPRPMQIGVVSYRTIGTGSIVDAFESAETLKPAIFGYFSSREALDRLNLANEYRLQTDAPGIILNDEIGLYVEQDIAYRSVIAIRRALAECRDLLIAQNKARVTEASRTLQEDAGSDEAGNLQAFYTSMVDIAERERADAYQAVRDRLFPAEGDPKRNVGEVTIDSCLAGLVDLDAVQDAREVFIRSLAMMPLFPGDLRRDPYITPASLGTAARTVADALSGQEADFSAGGVSLGATIGPASSVRLAEFNRRIAELEASRVNCILTRRYNFPEAEEPAFRMQYLDGDRLSVSLAERFRGEEVIDHTQPVVDVTYDEACLQMIDEQINAAKEGLSAEQLALRNAYSTVAEAVGRHIYRAHFDPIRRSMCGDDLGHQICAMGYPEATRRLVAALEIDWNAADAIARTLLPEEPASQTQPEPEVTDEGKPERPHNYPPGIDCGYGTHKICP